LAEAQRHGRGDEGSVAGQVVQLHAIGLHAAIGDDQRVHLELHPSLVSTVVSSRHLPLQHVTPPGPASAGRPLVATPQKVAPLPTSPYVHPWTETRLSPSRPGSTRAVPVRRFPCTGADERSDCA